MAKRKNNERYIVDEEGEIVRVNWTNQDIKMLAYYPTMVVMGVICLFIGLAVGLVAQASFDRIDPDSSMRNIMNGCFSSFNTADPDHVDVLNIYYYKTNVVSSSLISCLTSSEIETVDANTNKKVSPEALKLSMVGCFGSIEVTFNLINSNADRREFFDCLNNNNLRFRFIVAPTLNPTLIAISTPIPPA